MTPREKLLAIAKEVAISPDIELVFNEEDDSTKENKEAAHFFKHKGKRIGRDIELYAFMGKMSSEIEMLVDFLSEVIFPLNLHDSKASKSLLVWGFEILPEDKWDDWGDMFVEGGN
jgi:hypothetical protein